MAVYRTIAFLDIFIVLVRLGPKPAFAPPQPAFSGSPPNASEVKPPIPGFDYKKILGIPDIPPTE